MDILLQVNKLDAGYGDVQVLWEIDFQLKDGEIVSIVGPNGAGKTTFLYVLSGMLQPMRGQILYDGEPLIGMTNNEIVKRGITLVPEGRRLFPGMDVLDNLLMGAYARRKDGKHLEDLEKVYGYFPILKDRCHQLAGKLSGGEQQMCAIGRGLMARPKIFLIDEFSLGLAPMVVEMLVEVLKEIHKEGRTILLVEQDVLTALNLANRGYVIETGKIVMSNSSLALLNDDKIKKSYLGI